MGSKINVTARKALRYGVGLALIAALFTASYLALHVSISAQENTTAVVSMSARQSMFSQRIAFFSQALVTAQSPQEFLEHGKELHATVDLMERAHISLTNGMKSLGSPDTMSDTIRRHYFEAPNHIDRTVRQYINAARLLTDQLQSAQSNSNQLLTELLGIGATKLPNLLDQVANQYKIEGQALAERIAVIELIVWLVALTLLSLEFVLIFQPMARRVTKQISDLTASQEKLATKTVHLESILENVNHGISLMDNNFSIVAVNKKFSQLLGLPHDTFGDGASLEDIIRYNAERGEYGPGDSEILIRERMELARLGKPHKFERVRPDGTTLLIQGNILPDGSFVTTYTDITERKKDESALLNAKLEAERASKAKSEFLASMSHELRTPLNAILGFAEMMLYDQKDRISLIHSERIGNILKGGKHLLDLVNEILDLATIDADQISLTLEEVAAEKVAADCVALVQPLSHSRQIRVVNQLEDKISTRVRTDKMRLKQVLINLLSNAVKYNTDQGTVTVWGKVVDNGFYRISVSDTGIGIAERDTPSVFQVFHRLDAKSSIAREGSGIGLSVSKLLVERMAGRIGFKSKQNVGSTFWIELPLVSNEEVMIWNDNLRVGVDAIDKDHQVIATLLNKITHQPDNNEGLDDLIDDLITFTKNHFRRELVVMEVCKYPDLENHNLLHQDMVEQAENLVRIWNEDRDQQTLLQLRKYLRQQLAGHIMQVDTEIAVYAKQKKHDIRAALDALN